MSLEMAKTHFVNNLIPMLEKAYIENITEFRLKMFDKNHFFVHPFGKDGETIDIKWIEPNKLIKNVDV